MARTQNLPARLRPHPHWMVWLALPWMIPGHAFDTSAGPSRGFLGFACRDARCGSHKAGFDWAERNGVEDARSCQARNDEAFAEGCRAYVNEAVTPEQAGFEWASENDLTDTCHCAGAGPGFQAGCEAYVRGVAD